VVKVTDTVVVSINSSETEQKVYTIGGLPFSTAIFYASLFVVAFWFYSVLWPSAPIMEPDSGGYLRTAQDLSDFHIDQMQERVPGYPLLLLLTGASRSPRTLFFVSLLLHFISIWLLGIVLYCAGLTQVKLNLFSLILLLPPFVEPAGYVLSENLTEAMLVTGFVSFVSWTLHKRAIWILISALTFGYAALTRPTYQILALVVAGYFLVAAFVFRWTPMKWKDATKGILMLLCGFFVIVGGYAFHNYRSFGFFGVTPNLGLNLSTKTFRFVERLPAEHAEIREILIKARNADLALTAVTGTEHTGYMYLTGILPQLSKITGLEGPKLSDYMLKLNLLLIKKAPLHYLQEVVWAFGSYWLPSSTALANFDSRPVQFVWGALHFFLMAAFAYTLIVLVGAAIYIRKCKRFVKQRNNIMLNSERRLIHSQAFSYGLAGTIVIYTAAVSCLIEVGDPRYRLPTDALIVFMLFLGTHLWWRLVDLSRTVLERTQAGTE
jgi:hypothetical protein